MTESLSTPGKQQKYSLLVSLPFTVSTPAYHFATLLSRTPHAASRAFVALLNHAAARTAVPADRVAIIASFGTRQETVAAHCSACCYGRRSCLESSVATQAGRTRHGACSRLEASPLAWLARHDTCDAPFSFTAYWFAIALHGRTNWTARALWASNTRCLSCLLLVRAP